MCGKSFSIYGDHTPRKSLNLCIFTHALVPDSKLLNLFPPRQKWWEEAIKIQSENMKMASNISLFLFGIIAIFLNVMTLQSCK